MTCAVFAQADANHLVISEVGLYPTLQDPAPSDEFIEIFNPTNGVISLDNYYLSDSNLYSRLPMSPDGKIDTATTDQIVKFPAGYALQPGQIAVVTGGSSSFFTDFFSSTPEPFTGASGAPLLFEIADESTTVSNMISLNSNATAPLNFSLTNAGAANGEFVVLFYWDGISDLVRDVDMVSWGTVASGQNLFAPKNSATGYLKDNGSHAGMSVASGGADVIYRTSTAEASEASSGGNGLTGHDETTETPVNWAAMAGRSANMTPGTTALTVNSENVPPVIHSLSRDKKYPAATDPLILTANVSDPDGSISSVVFHVNSGSGFTALPAVATGTTYTAVVPPLGHAGVVQYYVTATDNNSLSSTVPNDGASAPVFVQVDSPAPGTVVINEIQFDIIGTDTTEWFELYNRSSSPVSLAGWRVGNSSEKYLVLPAEAEIAAKGFFIVTYKEPALRGFYPDIPAAVPVYEYPFGQGNTADTLWIANPNEYNFDGSNVTRYDEVSYSKVSPWPTLNPNTTGQSFELKDPALDNNDGANWEAHPEVIIGGVYKNSGTPGAPNSVASSVTDWSVY